MAAGCGAVLRLPYTFAAATFGGRNWTIASAGLLLVPCFLTAILLTPGVGFSTLLLLAAVGGVGGGNFASSMTNINAFYPNRLKGWALGLNAAGGNLGVATMQLIGLLVLATAGVNHPRLVLAIYVPLIVIGMLGAALSLFVFSGIGNGSTYKMIPAIFKAKADKAVAAGAGKELAAAYTRRMSGALIGIAGAIGALGGMLVNVAFRQSFLHTKSGDAAYLTFVIFYRLCFALTWFVYLRPSKHRLAGI